MNFKRTTLKKHFLKNTKELCWLKQEDREDASSDFLLSLGVQFASCSLWCFSAGRGNDDPLAGRTAAALPRGQCFWDCAEEPVPGCGGSDPGPRCWGGSCWEQRRQAGTAASLDHHPAPRATQSTTHLSLLEEMEKAKGNFFFHHFLQIQTE